MRGITDLLVMSIRKRKQSIKMEKEKYITGLDFSRCIIDKVRQMIEIRRERQHLRLKNIKRCSRPTDNLQNKHL